MLVRLRQPALHPTFPRLPVLGAQRMCPRSSTDDRPVQELVPANPDGPPSAAFPPAPSAPTVLNDGSTSLLTPRTPTSSSRNTSALSKTGRMALTMISGIWGACAARPAISMKGRMALLALGACALGGGILMFSSNTGLPDANPFKDQSQTYLGSYCNAIDGSGCNPTQLPMYTNAPYIPNVMLKTTGADIAIDQHERISEITSVSYVRQVSEQMGAVAHSFGLQGAGIIPTKGGATLAFSSHLGHSELTKDMYLSDTRSFYAKMSRTYTVFTAELRSQHVGTSSLPFKYQPSFEHDVRQLPDGAPNGTALKKWYCFFDTWGTHYVKSVTFGGELVLRTFIDERATKDDRTQDSSWKFNLDLMFRKSAGLPLNLSGGIGAASEKQREAYNAFQDYTSQQYFYAVGGDYSKKQDYHEWLGTVKENPAPIFTTLAPLSDILPVNKHFKTAYDAYLSKCPSTKEGGVCNGLGSCTSCEQERAYCVCAPGTYLVNGVCTLCPGDENGVCNGRGDCRYGKCQCKKFTPPPPISGGSWKFDHPPFSYKGPACETKCGSFKFEGVIGDNPVLGLPGSDHHPHAFAPNEGSYRNEGRCFCQKKTGINDADMQVTYTRRKKAHASTYRCINGERVCHPVTMFDWCWHYDVVTCQFGDEESCSEYPQSSVVAKSGRMMSATNPVMRSNVAHPIAFAMCVDFRKNAIPCDELENARAFNRRLNEGLTAPLSRTYEWVRTAMTQEGLIGSRWHVGHMCPNGGGPRTGRGAGPGDQARNLLAQTAKDNAGLGDSKRMTAEEAAFYSRKLTCDGNN